MALVSFVLIPVIPFLPGMGSLLALVLALRQPPRRLVTVAAAVVAVAGIVLVATQLAAVLLAVFNGSY